MNAGLSIEATGKGCTMFEDSSNPWEVREIDFPSEESPARQLRYLLNYAVLAPSRHNTQPWLFTIEHNVVELHADRSRRLPAVDADDRELTISCGAALENLLIAMRYFGYAPDVSIQSHAERPDLLARISLFPGEKATEEEHKLFHAIRQRRTNRHLFNDKELPATLLFAFEDIAMQLGTSFQVVPEASRPTLVNLITSADRLLWEDARYRQELSHWVRPSQDESRDGVPDEALGQADLAASLGPPALHTLIHREEPRRPLAAPGSPVLAVISTFADSWFDWLAAGQTLERILLLARASRVWASFFSQPTEVAASRTALRDLLGRRDDPQVVLRMGYGPDVPPTPRRSVSEVLLNESG